MTEFSSPPDQSDHEDADDTDGLVSASRPPWMVTTLGKHPPSTHPWGHIDGEGNAHGHAQRSDLARAVALDQSQRISQGWRPESLHLQWIATLVPEAILERDARALTQRQERRRAALAFSVVILVGLAVLFATGRSLPPALILPLIIILAPVFQIGISESMEAWLVARRIHANPAAHLHAFTEQQCFTTWAGTQRSPGTWALALVFVAFAVVQWHIGWSSSVHAAALVKPRIIDEPWRLLTAAYLHGGIIHVAFNALVTLQLARVCELLVGIGRTWLIWIVGALCGAVLSWWWQPDGTSVGASGGVLAFGGAVIGFALRRREMIRIGVVGALLRWMLLIAVIGIIGIGLIDNAGHLGGALGGFIIGALLPPSWGPKSMLHYLAAALGWLSVIAGAVLTVWALLQIPV